ncbi:MAG: dihydrolipoyl dehydrogenase [Sulfuriferula sp.]
MIETVDVLIIGAGGGGYPAGFRLANAGKSVVMIDPKGVMSGNCLAEGCVPSKAIREAAELFLDAQRGKTFGLTGTVNVDYHEVIAYKDQVQRNRYVQHAQELNKLGDRLRLIKGHARFKDAHTLVIATEQGERSFYAAHIIIASGCEIFIPPIPGAELTLTSHDLFAVNPILQEIPKRLAVIGGGYIGFESATFFRAFGSEVTIIESGDKMLSGMDPDFVSCLLPLLDPAIRQITQAHVEAIERVDDGSFQVRARQDNKAVKISADAVLLAVGRHPVLPEGLQLAGVAVEKGNIIVDDTLRTSIPHIYACGDVNGRVPLFHAAVGQSLIAAHNILGGRQPLDHFDFSCVPTTIFTLPAAAYVGKTRAPLFQHGITNLEAAYSFTRDSRAQILDKTGGEIRLFFESGSLRLLGGWVIGVDAAQLIGEIGLAVSRGLSARDLAAFCDQHPMASEGISAAARSLF